MFFMLLSRSTFPPEINNLGLISSLVMIIAAVLLWITFFLFGVIAKRYEKVLRRNTGWQFIMVAPSGILIFAIIMLYASIVSGKLKMGTTEAAIAYGLFFLSGLLSLIGALNFRRVVYKKRGEK